MTMPRTLTLTTVLALLVTAGSRADDYTVEPVSEPIPDSVSPEIAGKLSADGLKIAKGTRTLCTLWLAKEWPVDPTAKTTSEVLYPFKPGQLIGVVKFPRKAADFRDQVVKAGVYTLRYGQQPVDGAHVGTSPTRDFLMLVGADVDTAVEVTDMKKLGKQSAEAAGSNHPLLLSMQRAQGNGPVPSLRHDEEREWWILRIAGTTKSGKLPVDLVVVGKSAG